MTTPSIPHPILKHQPVRLVSGKETVVQTDLEAEWFNETRNLYLKDLKFTEQTDLADLDRVLILELMVFRWTQQLSKGEDYEGDPVDSKQMAMDLRGYSDQISKLKENMAISKKQRDSAANDGNFSAWFTATKARAMKFGIHRQQQLNQMISLGKELFYIVDTFKRSDDEERVKMGFPTEHSIFEWVDQTMRPEFDALDKYFREHEQKLWVREM
jgi:hypothetical protein